MGWLEFLGIGIPILTWGCGNKGGIGLGGVENKAQVYPPLSQALFPPDKTSLAKFQGFDQIPWKEKCSLLCPSHCLAPSQEMGIY